ncbi:putative transcriptional regulatory protein [Nostocoides japonicum T1-X7]|uniref:Putative transcriptional regulatory protein n=1 Tax=Nostocoides japonicum T1-X7 TaxID=1194083 RepID=A0A077M0J1_9MICO|nr:excisionase family DNA-binding protein [Tetrasphaera japonica]CCH79813.1 putative transcriptional regulatory protein [Tetrasphaera japonica T1-X7]
MITGQAAQLLGCSREHVVDLCETGGLPFLTVGTHRRVRREDVEELRERTTRTNRPDRRSRWLNIAVAGELARDPEIVLRRARANLELLQAEHPGGRGAMWLQEWERLLDGPVEDVLDLLTSQTPHAQELRANSPLAGVLSSADRDKALHAFYTHRTPRAS